MNEYTLLATFVGLMVGLWIGVYSGFKLVDYWKHRAKRLEAIVDGLFETDTDAYYAVQRARQQEVQR